MTTLHDKMALVTGASRGIGHATVTALAEAGAHVLVYYGRSNEMVRKEKRAIVSDRILPSNGRELSCMGYS